MHMFKLAAAAALVMFAGAAYAQDWIDFTERTEKFFVNFPAQPKVEEFPYESEYGFTVSAKKFTATRGEASYSVTVVNYAKTPEVMDVLGSVAFAAHNIRETHEGKIVYDAFAQIDMIDGLQIQINEADGHKYWAEIHMHKQDKRLYILEARTPPGQPPPAAFQVSLQILDDEGRPIRYQADGVTRAGRGGGAPAAAAVPAPAAPAAAGR